MLIQFEGSGMTPERRAEFALGDAIERAEERGDESISIFRTAGPNESNDIRSSGVFRLGANQFPKQFTVLLQDAVGFQESLPTFGNQNNNSGFGLPHTIFAAQISLDAALSMVPTIITDHRRASLILTAQNSKVLGRVNSSVLANGGIKELNTR